MAAAFSVIQHYFFAQNLSSIEFATRILSSLVFAVPVATYIWIYRKRVKERSANILSASVWIATMLLAGVACPFLFLIVYPKVAMSHLTGILILSGVFCIAFFIHLRIHFALKAALAAQHARQ